SSGSTAMPYSCPSVLMPYPTVVAAIRCMSCRKCNRSGEVGCILCNEAVSTESVKTDTKPDPGQSDKTRQRRPLNSRLFRVQDRHRGPVHVEPVHHYKPHGHERHDRTVTFRTLRQQYPERNYKMEKQEDG